MILQLSVRRDLSLLLQFCASVGFACAEITHQCAEITHQCTNVVYECFSNNAKVQKFVNECYKILVPCPIWCLRLSQFDRRLIADFSAPRRMQRNRVIFVCLLLGVTGWCACDALKISAFNIQIFGRSKFQKEDVVATLVRVSQSFVKVCPSSVPPKITKLI